LNHVETQIAATSVERLADLATLQQRGNCPIALESNWAKPWHSDTMLSNFNIDLNANHSDIAKLRDVLSN